MTKEALKLALEMIQDYVDEYGPHDKDSGAQYVITAIKEALAQPEQPKVRTGNCLRVGVCASEGHKIQPQHKPLTDEETYKIQTSVGYSGGFSRFVGIVRAIEAAHGIKGEA